VDVFRNQPDYSILLVMMPYVTGWCVAYIRRTVCPPNVRRTNACRGNFHSFYGDGVKNGISSIIERNISIYDDEHSSDNEERWITLSQAENGTLLVVVHTFEETGDEAAEIRLISAREATRNERRQYEDG
jgi:hypothetical protein